MRNRHERPRAALERRRVFAVLRHAVEARTGRVETAEQIVERAILEHENYEMVEPRNSAKRTPGFGNVARGRHQWRPVAEGSERPRREGSRSAGARMSITMTSPLRRFDSARQAGGRQSAGGRREAIRSFRLECRACWWRTSNRTVPSPLWGKVSRGKRLPVVRFEHPHPNLHVGDVRLERNA